MSSRAVYIPPGKRKNKQQRFHGAFTGGFSAGYFNTVDTKEGWKPSNDTTKQQKLEDFMDEQDHEEWGGPTNVRKEYDTTVGESSEAVKKLEQQHPQHQYVPLGSLFTISHQTVGPRLLRKLGWREEGGKAFVPSNDDNNVHQGETDDKDVSSDIILSKKRLKKIKLQTARVKIPAPKLDPCGLGFEPHKDAPEFRQYRERRKQMARERGIGRPDRYMTSTLTAESERGATRVDKQQNNANQVDDYLAYETAEDFVGKRSVGGFALRDDDDDAYDNDDHRPTRMKLGEEYNAEIYEHQDSDDDGDVMGGGLVETKEGVLKQKDGDLGDILASWATKPTQDKSSSSIALTSDGRPPLEGFLLGGSMQSHKMRYPGPDIPRDYHITRHKFGENEHPLIFQTIARAVQLQERDRQRQEYNKRQNQQLTMLQQKSFSNLASAMKSRFTTSKDEEPKGPERVGLYQPEVLVQKEVEEQAESHTAETPKPITLKRTVQTFLPHPLVCKRFGVPVPKNAVGFDQHNPTSFTKPPSRQTEANYFEKEILTARNNDSSLTTEKAKASGQSTNEHVQDQEEDDGMTGIQRPSIEKLKAIFEPESESESDTDLDASSDDEKSIVSYSNSTAKEGSSQMIVYEEKDDEEQSDSSSSTKSSTRHHRKEHHGKKHHRSKSKRRRKRDRSPDSDDDRRRRKERRKKHERKRRKKSSRRKAEKDRKF